MNFLINKSQLPKLIGCGKIIVPRQRIDLVQEEEGSTKLRLVGCEVASEAGGVAGRQVRENTEKTVARVSVKIPLGSTNEEAGQTQNAAFLGNGKTGQAYNHELLLQHVSGSGKNIPKQVVAATHNAIAIGKPSAPAADFF
jgi:hypothetical protein